MNDRDLKGTAALAISELYVRKIGGEIITALLGYNNWTKMIPSRTEDTKWLIRSMLWMRSDVKVE